MLCPSQKLKELLRDFTNSSKPVAMRETFLCRQQVSQGHKRFTPKLINVSHPKPTNVSPLNASPKLGCEDCTSLHLWRILTCDPLSTVDTPSFFQLSCLPFWCLSPVVCIRDLISLRNNTQSWKVAAVFLTGESTPLRRVSSTVISFHLLGWIYLVFQKWCEFHQNDCFPPWRAGAHLTGAEWFCDHIVWEDTSCCSGTPVSLWDWTQNRKRVSCLWFRFQSINNVFGDDD